jgi:hypothetical protein
MQRAGAFETRGTGGHMRKTLITAVAVAFLAATSASYADQGKGKGKGKGKGGSGESDDEGGPTVILCHIPPGNHAMAHTITVGEGAVSAHLAHGDYVGACH